MTDATGTGQQQVDLAGLWSRAVETLSRGAQVWVYNAEPIERHPGLFIVGVPDDLSRAQLESRVRPALEHALSSALDEQVRLLVTIEPTLGTRPQQPEVASEPTRPVD